MNFGIEWQISFIMIGSNYQFFPITLQAPAGTSITLQTHYVSLAYMHLRDK